MAGVSGWLGKASPLLLSLSALLGALSHILGQAGQNTTPAGVLDLLKNVGGSADRPLILLSLAAIKKHFSHNDNAGRIAELEKKLADKPAAEK